MNGVDADLGGLALLGDTLPARLDTLRAHDPLQWSESGQCWIVTSHSLVTEGFSGRLPLSAERQHLLAGFFPDAAERTESIGYVLEVFPDFVINTDPPKQSRLRRLLLTAFSRQVAESYRDTVCAIVAEVLAALGDRTEIDFVRDVARPVTARAILHVIGLPSTYLERMEDWAITINAGLSGNPDKVMMARTNGVMKEMRDLFLIEIDKRGADRGTDFLSHLLDARDGNDRLTRNELVAQLILILIAGHDTTLNTTALAIARLAYEPEKRAYMRGHPESFEAIIMELMRVIAMSTSMARVVSEDFAWAGKELKAGQSVFLMIAAANRDPAVFPDPDRIDFHRSQAGNMTFAPGKHFCIGHWFAKMMMSEIFPAFLGRYESWDLLDEHLAFTPGLSFRGPTSVAMRLHPH